jgi:hypothetical protein
MLRSLFNVLKIDSAASVEYLSPLIQLSVRGRWRSQRSTTIVPSNYWLRVRTSDVTQAFGVG